MTGSLVTRFSTHHPGRQAKVMDRAGLADRTKEPAHPCGCPHTVHRKNDAVRAQACSRKQKAADHEVMARLLRLG